MKIYIASKYLEHKEINQNIYEALISEQIDAFLPKSINVDAITEEEMLLVAETCYNEIEQCDIILIVTPFGKSVSSEIGYTISLKRNKQPKKMILFNQEQYEDTSLKKEAMIIPYIDAEVTSITELISHIKNQL